MLYNVLSQERPHTRPSRFVYNRSASRRPRSQGRDPRSDIMTFSVEEARGFSDERGSMTPVDVADLWNRTHPNMKAPTQQPVSAFDTGRGRAPLVSRDGMNLRAGIGLLLTVIVLLLAVVAVSYGQIASINQEANTARARVDALKDMCDDIREEIAQSATEINIAISAVNMGMISARGVEVIYLTAPETAVMSNPDSGLFSIEYLSASLGQ